MTNSNYLDNEEIIKVAEFFKKNFTLFSRDDHQNTYMHAFLPVDMRKTIPNDQGIDVPNPGFGEFFFKYKTREGEIVEYRGNGRDGHPSVWEGMRLIQERIRTSENVSELMETLDLVNSWYADNTTLAEAAERRRRPAGSGRRRSGGEERLQPSLHGSYSVFRVRQAEGEGRPPGVSGGKATSSSPTTAWASASVRAAPTSCPAPTSAFSCMAASPSPTRET